MKSTKAFTAGCLLLLIGSGAQAGELTAQLAWSQPLALSTPLSGVVATVSAEAGQTVAQGALLLSLDPTPFKAQVAEARADAERLAEEAADAKRELARAEELYARTVTATTELDAAKLKQARASAALAAAQARLERARWQLAQTELRAPFPAIILERRAVPGMVVAAQCQPPTLFTIAHAEEMLARAPLTAKQASSVRPGMRAEVLFGGKSHPGRVRSLSYTGSGEAAAYSVEVVIARTPGMTAGLPASLRLMPE